MQYGSLRSSQRFFGAIALGLGSWLWAGSASLAETVSGTVTSYAPERKEATIDLGSNAGIRTGDLGSISIPALSQGGGVPFGAFVSVVDVTPDSAVVSIRESDGVAQAIAQGLPVIIDAGASPAPQVSQTEPASEVEPVPEASEVEAESTSSVEPVAEASPVEPAPEGELASEASPQQPQPLQSSQSLLCPPQSLPELSDSNLPENYLQSYAAARTQPSPPTYYAFAKTLIDYELADEALLWLDEAEKCFPKTRSVNRLYRAVALGQKDRFAEAELALNEATQFANEPIYTEIESYLATRQGNWEEVIALADKEPTDITIGNHLIAQYCAKPPLLERKSEIPPSSCPFGNPIDVEDPSDAGREELSQVTARFGERETENTYLLNTLGFLALQMEDYDLAFRYYTQLSEAVENRDLAEPGILALQASADTYVRNYEQNIDFLKEKEQDIALLRSQRRTVTAISTAAGVASVATRIGGSSSTGSIIGTGVVALARLFGGRRQSRRLKREQRELLDNVRQTFLSDITLLPARPDLDPNRLLSTGNLQAPPIAPDAADESPSE